MLGDSQCMMFGPPSVCFFTAADTAPTLSATRTALLSCASNSVMKHKSPPATWTWVSTDAFSLSPHPSCTSSSQPYLRSNLLSLSLFPLTWVCTVISHQEITQLGVLPSCTSCSVMLPPPAARVTFQNRRSERSTALSIWPQFIFCFHHTIFFI